MNAPLASPTAETFSLKRRSDGGRTPACNYWGCPSEDGVLHGVLLGKADHIKPLSPSSLSRKYLRESPCNIEVAKKQHAELISAYEHFGVRGHFHQMDPNLPYQVYARDSSFMTPFGAVITNMANWWRRGETFAAIRSYQALGIPIYDMITAGHFEGGDFNLTEPGCVLIGCGGGRTPARA